MSRHSGIVRTSAMVVLQTPAVVCVCAQVHATHYWIAPTHAEELQSAINAECVRVATQDWWQIIRRMPVVCSFSQWETKL